MTPRPPGRVRLAVLASLLAASPLCAQAPEFNLFGAPPEAPRAQDGNPVVGFLVRALGGGERRERDGGQVQPLAHALTFQDGRRLRGELVSLNKDELVWKRADASEPLRFSRKLVRRISLGASPGAVQMFESPEMGFRQAKRPATAATSATIKLPGSDWLYAEVTSPDGETFHFSLGGDSKFTAPRGAVEWMHFGMSPVPAASLAPGTMALEGWVRPTPTGSVEEKNGLLSVKGVDWIGKNVSPPARFEMAFDLRADDPKTTTLWIQPFGPQPNCYGTGTIELDFMQGTISRCIYINNMNHEKSQMPKDAGPDGRARFRVFYDGVDGKLLVYRNGKEVGNWKTREDKDKDAQQRNGWPRGINGVCLQREGGPEVGQFRIQPWDGVLPVEGAADRTQDSYTAGKEAPVLGKLESIDEKELTFSGTKKARETGIFLQLHSQPKPLAGAEALLLFGNRGELSAGEVEISGGRAQFRTSFADRIEVPVSALNEISFAPAAVEPVPSSALVFKNGDELPGTLLHAQNGASLKWRTDSGQEVQFEAGRFAGVRLVAPQGEKSAPAAVVELCNGDRLRGEFTGLDPQRALFRHPVLGNLEFPRTQLSALFPNPKTAIFDAASDPSSWFEGDSKAPAKAPGLVHLDGRFILSAGQNSDARATGISRPLAGLPEKFELRCEIADMSGNEPNLSVRLMGESGEMGSSSLDLEFNYGSLRLYGWVNGKRSRSFWKDVTLRNQRGGYRPTARIAVRLFVDNKAGTVDVYVNGEHKAKCGQAQNERIPGIGHQVSINGSGNSTAPAVLSDLWAGPWNGELPKAEHAGQVTLSNGDVAEAAPSELKDGKLLVDLGGGPMEVPIARVDAVSFGTKPSPTPAVGRIRLATGDALSVESFKVEAGRLIARSPVLGEWKVDSAKVREIVFDAPPARFPMAPEPKKKPAAGADPEKVEVERIQGAPPLAIPAAP